MSAQLKAKKIREDLGTQAAAAYLKRRGYSLKAALHVLLGAEVRK